MKTLSILICTTFERETLFLKLLTEFHVQAQGYSVEILFEQDDKQISVGAKRQKLLDRAQGEYIVYFDDDDWPELHYISEIIKALETKPDCLGYRIRMTTNEQREEMCCHSLRYPQWRSNVDGYNYVRNVTHFNVVKRSIATQVGFPDKRFGEDKVYSDQVTALCKTEVFIDKVMFHYRYSNRIPHKRKYGIR